MSLSRVPVSKGDKICCWTHGDTGFPPWELESVWLFALDADLSALNSEIGALVWVHVTVADVETSLYTF